MREELYLTLKEFDSRNNTPNEIWTTKRGVTKFYDLQTDFAKEKIGKGPGKLLIVGSPIIEAVEFIKDGWDVTYVDVRTPPKLNCTVLKQDICTADFDPVFDAVSSNSVLCHVGMGRYGDMIVEDADERALKNIYMALKPGGIAVITFGAIANIFRPARIENVQRVYNHETICSMSFKAGFAIVDMKIMDGNAQDWIPLLPLPVDEKYYIDRHMISVLLKKYA